MNMSTRSKQALTGLSFTISSLHEAYKNHVVPSQVMDEVYRRINEAADPAIFISLFDRKAIAAQISTLGPFDPLSKPLWGIPFVVKDNIDVQGLDTTAACPAFAYMPDSDATAITRLRKAGAIVIGKTNLDQFATGLVGVRSPFGVPRNAMDETLVPGGSSSGSAVAVARNIVTFALGTDTAGSGRVPAALNNIVGLKPTLGVIPNTGVVPACRTLDTISVFALTVNDAWQAFTCMAGPDASDAYSRDITPGELSPLPPHFTIAVPDAKSREFFGDNEQATSFDAAVSALAQLGGKIVELDLSLFYETAQLLYDGPWVAERYTVIAKLLAASPQDLLPVTSDVIRVAERFSAADVFRAQYKLQDLKKQTAPMIEGLFALCVPTIPSLCTREDIAREPIAANARLGVYTNFVNLLDMCGIAVPVAPRKDGQPGSVTLLARAGADARLASLAGVLHSKLAATLGATSFSPPPFEPATPSIASDEIAIAVVGAHMSGLPLNIELTRLNARFVKAAQTANTYKFYALAGGPPARPGMIRSEGGGKIDLEIWAMPKTNFGAFMSGIPAPLGIGSIVLDNGESVKGFVCEPAGVEGAEDITHTGGWRNYMKAESPAQT